MENANLSGRCGKLTFFLILAVLCLGSTVICVDDETGQRKTAVVSDAYSTIYSDIDGQPNGDAEGSEKEEEIIVAEGKMMQRIKAEGLEYKKLKEMEEEKKIAEQKVRACQGGERVIENKMIEDEFKRKEEDKSRRIAGEKQKLEEEKGRKEAVRKKEDGAKIKKQHETKLALIKDNQRHDVGRLEKENEKQIQEEKDKKATEKGMLRMDKLKKVEEITKVKETERKKMIKEGKEGLGNQRLERERIEKENQEKQRTEIETKKKQQSEKLQAEARKQTMEGPKILEDEKQILEREKLEKEKAQNKTLENGKNKSKEEDGDQQKKLWDSYNLPSVLDELEITNEHDLQIKDVLDQLDASVRIAYKTQNRNDLNLALKKYDQLIFETANQSPRAVFQKAETLTNLSEIERSNAILEQAIFTFNSVLLMGPKVPDELFRMAGKKSVNLLRFRGWYDKAIPIQKMMLSKFPNIPKEINTLGRLFLDANNNSAAKMVFKQLLKQFPNDGYALANLGVILNREGRVKHKTVAKQLLERSAKYLKRGMQTKDLGTTEAIFYYALGDTLRRLGRTAEADRVYKEAAEEGAMLSFWQRSLHNVAGLKAKAVWMPEETGISGQLARIKQNWESIRKEALATLKLNLYLDVDKDHWDSGKWAEFMLYRKGLKNERNCKKAPVTCNLVDSIPQISTNRRGKVSFSIMEAGTHVLAHSGPTNCRLRAHLGLYIPENSPSTVPSKSPTKLRVANEYLVWSNGELLVFDDSYDHEVWHDNPQKEPRIVLILDLWHPELAEKQMSTLPGVNLKKCLRE